MPFCSQALFNRHAVSICVASHLFSLPFSDFPWENVAAIVHFDSVDPDAFLEEKPTPPREVMQLIREGKIEWHRSVIHSNLRTTVLYCMQRTHAVTFSLAATLCLPAASLDVDSVSSRVLMRPEDREFESLRMPEGVSARFLTSAEWMEENAEVCIGLMEAGMDLVPRMELNVTLILDASTAVSMHNSACQLPRLFERCVTHRMLCFAARAQCIVMALSPFVDAEDSRVALDALATRLSSLWTHYRHLHLFLYDAGVRAGSVRAKDLSEAENWVSCVVAECCIAAATVSTELEAPTWNMARVRESEELMLEILHSIRVAALRGSKPATEAKVVSAETATYVQP